ncbi:unnamed protein product, partial [marine sediment metagenome]
MGSKFETSPYLEVAISSLVFKDMVQPADGILPPGIPGYNEELLGLDFDLDGARELIAT